MAVYLAWYVQTVLRGLRKVWGTQLLPHFFAAMQPSCRSFYSLPNHLMTYHQPYNAVLCMHAPAPHDPSPVPPPLVSAPSLVWYDRSRRYGIVPFVIILETKYDCWNHLPSSYIRYCMAFLATKQNLQCRGPASARGQPGWQPDVLRDCLNLSRWQRTAH